MPTATPSSGSAYGANIGDTSDVDPDSHADCVWLSLRAFEHANRYTTAPAGTDLEGERQPGQKETKDTNGR